MSDKDKNQPLNVLFLSQRFLLPMDTGGKIRTGKILEQLKHLARITLVSNVESPRDDRYIPEMERFCHRFVPVAWKEVPRYSWRFYARVAFRSFSRYPINVLNDYSPSLEQALLKELAGGRYDLAVCDFLQSTLLFRQVEGVPRLLFQHNVETAIALRHFQQAGNPVARLFWWLQYRKMFRHERAMCRRFEGIIAVSEHDRSLMEQWFGATNVHTIPTGVDTDFFAPTGEPEADPPTLVFTGSMDWLPNEDAILYFVEEIFPNVQARHPGVRLLVVGRNPSPRLKNAMKDHPEVELTGWVEDTRPYIARSAVYVVPIRIGGGTRMKIYEAMAMGKAVVSTSVGAEGLPLTHGRHIFLEDEPEAFAERVCLLLEDCELRQRIGQQARSFVVEHFHWRQVAQRFYDICQTVAQSLAQPIAQAQEV